MEYLAGDDALKELPLLLAGPILRRTEADQVTVWVALKQSARVTLQVFQTQAEGHKIDCCLLQACQSTTALGRHLHVVAVTAKATDARDRLQPDCIYAYDLQFTTDKSYSLTAAIAPANRSADVSSTTLPTAESVSYFTHQKPTFALPPRRVKDLKIAHGSCRKPHGVGFDSLPILDCLVQETASLPTSRPHQLFLTGDQIYGDDVADPLLWLATGLGDALLGWEEPLPIEHHDDSSTAQPDRRRPKELLAGRRADLAIRRAGLTAGLNNKRDRTTSHLFSFGEYCASYLLAYSPACWPVHLPVGHEVTQGRKAIRRWNKDRRHMEQFLYTLWKVRRLLANVPTYTIFDDHDVSDDWNLNQDWCLRVLGRPLGRRTVQNALASYAVFQAWGNTPEQFEPGEPGSALLSVVQKWSTSAGQDRKAEAAIATYIGFPTIDPHTNLPQFVEEKIAEEEIAEEEMTEGKTDQKQTVWVLKRAERAINWHYTVRSACHEVIVLDTRTWRGYPTDGSTVAPPMLLSPSAFEQQIYKPLSLSSLEPSSEFSSASDNHTDYATFVVAPTNVFGMRALDWIQQWHLDQRKVFAADVGDSWNFHDEALATLLIALFENRQNIVVLSGDIHYSSAISVSYQNLISKRRATLVQLTASAIKNEELLTQLMHTRLKQWLLPEKPRQWIGYSSPPDLAELPASGKRNASGKSPDWQCQMTWLKRQRAQTVEMSDGIVALVPPTNKSWFSIVHRLQFWKARWFQEGAEVVGINNVALVHFYDQNTDCKKNVEEQPVLAIAQDHYWFSPWAPTQVVRSRFE